MTAAKSPFTILGSRPAYDNPWITVTHHRILKPRGGEGIYGVVHFKNRAVGVIPYDAGHVWLVGQYRFPLGQYSWEIPEGGAPEDEPLEDCARRELTEETGLTAGRLTPLLTLHLSNSVTDEIAHVYLATELSTGSAEPDDTEELALRRVPLDEVYRRVLSGAITDSMTVAGILRVVLMRQNGELP